MLTILLVGVLKLDILALRNDPKTLAIKWLNENISSKSKIIVYGYLFRLPTTKSALEELSIIDSSAIRKIDLAETTHGKNLRDKKTFHALNINNVRNISFYKNIIDYSNKNNYDYLVISVEKDSGTHSYFKPLIEKSALVKSFDTGSETEAFPISRGYYGGFENMINLEKAGSAVKIYRLTSSKTR